MTHDSVLLHETACGVKLRPSVKSLRINLEIRNFADQFIVNCGGMAAQCMVNVLDSG